MSLFCFCCLFFEVWFGVLVVMRVDLLDMATPQKFNIKSDSEAEQVFEKDSHAEWIFHVRPMVAGTSSLLLKFSIIKVTGADKKRKDLRNLNQNIYYNYNKYKFRSNVANFYKNLNYLTIDLIWIKIFSMDFSIKNYKTNLFYATN